MLLNLVGLVNYDSELPVDDPNRPADRSAAERICLASEWMAPACFAAWAVGRFRLQYRRLFDSLGRRRAPLGLCLLGVGILTNAWLRWQALPYSGQPFSPFHVWDLGLGWLLVWTGFVLRPGGLGQTSGRLRKGSERARKEFGSQ
jgi:hypothetical protein